jgi:hypothetical protein
LDRKRGTEAVKLIGFGCSFWIVIMKRMRKEKRISVVYHFTIVLPFNCLSLPPSGFHGVSGPWQSETSGPPSGVGFATRSGAQGFVVIMAPPSRGRSRGVRRVITGDFVGICEMGTTWSGWNAQLGRETGAEGCGFVRAL